MKKIILIAIVFLAISIVYVITKPRQHEYLISYSDKCITGNWNFTFKNNKLTIDDIDYIRSRIKEDKDCGDAVITNIYKF